MKTALRAHEEEKNTKKCRVICLASQKGGVAKTFTSSSVAAAIVRAGRKVLAIDNDPQGHCSRCLGVRKLPKDTPTIYTIMKKIINGESLEEREGIIRTAEGVDLLPSNISYAGMEMELISAMNRERILKEYVDSVRDNYDYIIIDCPPNLGLLVINALAAVDEIIIPVMTEDLSIDGLQQLIQTIGLVKRRINNDVKIGGIVFTRVDKRTRLANEAMETVRKKYEGKLRIFDTFIPQSIRAAECPSTGTSIFEYDPNGKVADAYTRLTEEVLADE